MGCNPTLFRSNGMLSSTHSINILLPRSPLTQKCRLTFQHHRDKHHGGTSSLLCRPFSWGSWKPVLVRLSNSSKHVQIGWWASPCQVQCPFSDGPFRPPGKRQTPWPVSHFGQSGTRRSRASRPWPEPPGSAPARRRRSERQGERQNKVPMAP